MIICFEAGYSNEHALEKIANEFGDLFPELSAEFLITANELKILSDMQMPIISGFIKNKITMVYPIANHVLDTRYDLLSVQ